VFFGGGATVSLNYGNNLRYLCVCEDGKTSLAEGMLYSTEPYHESYIGLLKQK
jgi:hypothetical protein